MKFRMGMRKIVAGPGDTVVVPAGRVQVLQRRRRRRRARVEVVPALDMEQLFETTVEPALEGNTNSKGMPKPLHLALFTRRLGPRGGPRPAPARLDGAHADGPGSRGSRAAAATPSATRRLAARPGPGGAPWPAPQRAARPRCARGSARLTCVA